MASAVEGLELIRYKNDSVERGILDPTQSHVGNGLDFLHKMADRGESCDLITAFMLGPDDTNGTLARQLVVPARRALSTDGHILIRSDGPTTRTTIKVLNDERVVYINDDHTLIISFDYQRLLKAA